MENRKSIKKGYRLVTLEEKMDLLKCKHENMKT